MEWMHKTKLNEYRNKSENTKHYWNVFFYSFFIFFIMYVENFSFVLPYKYWHGMRRATASESFASSVQNAVYFFFLSSEPMNEWHVEDIDISLRTHFNNVQML